MNSFNIFRKEKPSISNSKFL